MVREVMEDRVHCVVLLGFVALNIPRTLSLEWCAWTVDRCLLLERCTLTFARRCACGPAATGCGAGANHSRLAWPAPAVRKYCRLHDCVMKGHWCPWSAWRQVSVHHTCESRGVTDSRRRAACCHPGSGERLSPCPVLASARPKLDHQRRTRWVITDDLCPPDVSSSKGAGGTRGGSGPRLHNELAVRSSARPNSLLIACVSVGVLVLLIIVCVVRRTKTRPDDSTILPPRPIDSSDDVPAAALALHACSAVDCPPPGLPPPVWEDLPPSYDEVMGGERRTPTTPAL